MLVPATVIVCLAVACLVYGWFEAGWLRTRVLDVEIEGLSSGPHLGPQCEQGIVGR